MTTNDHIALRRAEQLLELRREFSGWRVNRADSGWWLAIQGNTCIRATSAPELRRRLREFIDSTAAKTDGGEPA